MKKNKKIVYVCEKCGYKPNPIKKGKNFDTYPTICPLCEGTITLKLEVENER